MNTVADGLLSSGFLAPSATGKLPTVLTTDQEHPAAAQHAREEAQADPHPSQYRVCAAASRLCTWSTRVQSVCALRESGGAFSSRA